MKQGFLELSSAIWNAPLASCLPFREEIYGLREELTTQGCG